MHSFLQAAQGSYTEEGNFGTVNDMKQVYHATQLVRDLRQVEGCLESAMTQSEAERFAVAYTEQMVKDVFLRPTNEMQVTMDSLLSALQVFVSMASNIETGIALREIEIHSGKRHLDILKTQFHETFGKVDIEGNRVTIGSEVIEEQAGNCGRYAEAAAGLRDAFKTAIGDVTPEEYAELRDKGLIRAMDWLGASAGAVVLLVEALPSPGTGAHPLWELERTARADSYSNTLASALGSVKAGWRSWGEESGLCAPPPPHEAPWYCGD